MVRVELCQDAAAWDRYVESQAEACNYHRWLWRKPIEDTFGHQAQYLAAYDNETLCGVLPLFSIRSRLFGNSLVSVPFFSYGGLLADGTEAREALLARAVELAQETGARHIELRQGDDSVVSWRSAARKVAMYVDLSGGSDELWERLSARLRKRIRHARKCGFDVRWGGAEDVSSFYSVFAANMRNLGTPVYPRAWFENLCASCPEEIRILTLWQAGKAVAGAFLVPFRDTLELPWAATLPESRRDFAPLLLYWTFLEWAPAHGFRRVDLGRCTPGSGNHDFKKHWTQVERPLPWYYWTADGAPLPQLRPDNPKFRLATRVWKLLPLAVANQLGPRIVRALP